MSNTEQPASTAVVVNAVYSKKDEYEVLKSEALCASITVMILGVFSLNVFAFLFGAIVLVTIHQKDLEARNWFRVVKPLYVILIVFLAIVLALAILLVIVAAYRTRTMYIVVGIVLFILSVFEVTYSSRAKMAVVSMFELGLESPEPTRNYLGTQEPPA